MSTRAKLRIIKSELDKIPEHFVQTILVRLAKTQQLVGSSFEIRKNGQLFYSLNFGREGGREGGGFWSLWRGELLLCLWNMACLEFHSFVEMQCSQIEWRRSKIHAWCAYHLSWTLSMISKSSPPPPSPPYFHWPFCFWSEFWPLDDKRKV